MASVWNFNPSSSGRTGTIQSFTIPATGSYKLEAWGAGSYGRGAYAAGTFTFNVNDVIKILVGQLGTNQNQGSGGTYIMSPAGGAYVIGGGGGGAGSSASSQDGADASGSNSGYGGYSSGSMSSPGGGGSGGNPGGYSTAVSWWTTAYCGGGGGIATGGPALGESGRNYNYAAEPGYGGYHAGWNSSPVSSGGYGGGGAAWTWSIPGGAGGGGYSGGGAGAMAGWYNGCGTSRGTTSGGGGGSYAGGTNPVITRNQRAANTAGYATITSQYPEGGQTNAATNVKVFSATLNGQLSNLGATGQAVTIVFDWGLTTSYGNTTSTATTSGAINTNYSVTISGLANNTTYHYRVRCYNGGGTTTGADVAFTTLPGTTTSAATNQKLFSATLNGNITQIDSSNPTRYLQYGPTTSYGTSINLGVGGAGVYSVDIPGLTPNTTYHARAYAIYPEGTAYGGDVTFSTKTGLVTVSTQAVTNVNVTTATGNGTIVSFDQ